MALVFAKHILRRQLFVKCYLFPAAYGFQGTQYGLGVKCRGHSYDSKSSQLSCKELAIVSLNYSTELQPQKLCWEGSAHEILLTKIEICLKNNELNEAWETFHDFKRLYGFPLNSLTDRLIVALCYSSDTLWLQKATELVLKIFKQKRDLLKLDTLTVLTLSLARSQMPLPASTILRLMRERKGFPEMSVLCVIVYHMVRTEIGTCLASNYWFRSANVIDTSVMEKTIKL